MKRLISLFFVLSALFCACENNDDLRAAIDDLDQRVKALETQVAQLNNNIAALQQLYNGATISQVVKSGDKYVLTLSNGEVIELTQGSTAEAIIPIVGITADGMWQYSIDNGATWIALNVSATSSDGLTPKFRIDAVTGYWQVSYDGTEWTNVLDTDNNPVKAVGEGVQTDLFFNDVQVTDGVLCITLKDGTVVRVPVIPDFLCKIEVPTAGTQVFGAGEVRTYNVTLKGAEDWMLTAPAGWKATLSEPANDAATLTVTAPTSVTRATADNTKDVALLALAKGYAAISKIAVELDAATVPTDPEEPTLTVAASTTVEATASTLTFDVQIANAEGWKYICQVATETAPDADRIATEGTAGSGTSVTVEGLQADTEYAFYAIAYTATAKSAVATATARTAAAAPATETDYYQMWNDGQSFTAGALTINKTNYPDAKLLTPAELDKATFDAGGLIFVDNTTASSATILESQTSVNLGANGDILLIGRYPERAQAELIVPEMRCNNDVTLMNLKFSIRSGSNCSNLITDGNAKKNPTLQFLGCTATLGTEKGRYVIYDVNPNYCFKDVLVENCVIEMNTSLTNSPTLFCMTTTVKSAYYNHSVVVKNNVIYATKMLQAAVVNIAANNANIATNDLAIEATNNTFYNIYQPNVLFRSALARHIIVEKNVGYVDYTAQPSTNPNYVMCVYTNTVDDGTSSVADNYLFGVGTAAGDKALFPWTLVHANNKATVSGADSSQLVSEATGNPFTSVDTAKGYFPINTSVVTNGAGASYATKTWMK